MFATLTRFAAEYEYSTFYSDSANGSGGGVSVVLMLFYIAVIVLIVAALWRVFTKAKQPGWAAIIPIYNTYIQLKIVGRPWWWLLLMFIPFVNFIIAIIVANDLSKSFGKGVGTTLLLIFLPFIGFPMLAWGDATYHGPSVKSTTTPTPTTSAQ